VVKSNLKIKIALLLIIITIIAIAIFSFLKYNWQNYESPLNIANSSSPYVKEYSLPEGARPNALLVDWRGIVWISTSSPRVLLALDPENKIIRDLGIEDISKAEPVKGNSTMIWSMIQDRENKIWFSELGTKSIWNLAPGNDTFHLIPSESGSPFQMKVDNHGNIWFTTLRENTIGVIEKLPGDNTYKILSFTTGNYTNPAGIFLQDNSIWIAAEGSQKILHYKINRENNSVKNISIIQSIPEDNELFSSPTDLLVNKNIVWLTEHGTSFLTSYDLDSGKITRYPTSQNHYQTTTLPFWIRASSDPKVLWFNEHQGNKIGCFDLYNNTLTEYEIPSLPKDGYITYPLNISEDPRDEKILWFSEWNTDKVGVINGHVKIPFELYSNTKGVELGSTKKDGVVDLEVRGNSPYHGKILLNASSSILPNAELGNLTVRFSSNVVDFTQDEKIKVFFHNGGISPGNYTVGISISDGIVTKTEFLNLSIPN
jgi:streptogramin lyase